MPRRAISRQHVPVQVDARADINVANAVKKSAARKAFEAVIENAAPLVHLIAAQDINDGAFPHDNDERVTKAGTFADRDLLKHLSRPSERRRPAAKCDTRCCESR